MIKRLTIGMLCLFAWVISHAQVVLPDNMEEADCVTDVESMTYHRLTIDLP